MSHGWTGGQYSLYRVVLGGYLVVLFAGLIPWGAVAPPWRRCGRAPGIR